MARLGPETLDLYVLTSGTAFPGRRHEDVAVAAIEGGASAVQLRAPELDDDELGSTAAAIAELASPARVLFVVNDRIDVALERGADGVHLGQGDELDGARARLGPNRVLGVSVGDVDEARAAEADDADYVAVTVWSTPTKPEAVPVGPKGVRAIAAATVLPVVGIGGIDAGNARKVLEAGAAGIAVIGAVAAAADPVEAVRELRAVVDAYRGQR